MKNKLLITAIISTALVLCSCGKNNEESVSTTVAETTTVQETTQTQTTTKVPETTTQSKVIQYVTYDEIKTGKYNSQDVYIKGVVSNVSYNKSMDVLDFELWVDNGASYVNDGLWMLLDVSTEKNISELSNAQNGYLYEFCVSVYEDSSFGSSSIKSVKNLNTVIDLSETEQQFKASTETTTTATEDTALFEDIYAEYVDPAKNERRPKVFSVVKTFVESTGYKTEIVNSESIKVFDDNGNYVYFGFKPLDGLDVINLITYYQASSNSEVSQKEYTGTELFKYEILTTHVIGEEEKEVDNIKQQKAFLFN